MVEASQLLDTKKGQKNQESRSGEDLAMFKKYSDAYEKCIQNGIVSYMISNECSVKTNQFVIKNLSRLLARMEQDMIVFRICRQELC